MLRDMTLDWKTYWLARRLSRHVPTAAEAAALLGSATPVHHGKSIAKASSNETQLKMALRRIARKGR
jgi:hypothetical protein